VHALEDEQTMEHDLTTLDFESPQKEILDVEDEALIVYDLENDIEALSLEDSEQLMDLIPTSELLKGIEVVEDVLYNSDDEEFIINTIEQEAEVSDTIANDEQTSLTFDLPISNAINSLEEGVEIFQLEDNVNNIEVDDFIELVSVSEVVGVGEQTYTLDDHIVIQQTNKKFDPSLETTTEAPEVEVEEEMVLTKVTVKERKVTSDPKENTNPFESPISKTLRDRADDRRQKMKAFNYKFNTSKIEEYENEPAYKRQGIELSDGPEDFENQFSRTSVTSDENEDIQVRSNNSFLHDNVD
jgi:cell division protein FtsZ